MPLKLIEHELLLNTSIWCAICTSWRTSRYWRMAPMRRLEDVSLHNVQRPNEPPMFGSAAPVFHLIDVKPSIRRLIAGLHHRVRRAHPRGRSWAAVCPLVGEQPDVVIEKFEILPEVFIPSE
jgi:hypothetical protein